MATSQTNGAPAATGVEPGIRVLETPGEMEACVQLQREAWGFADIDLVPRRLFVVARKIGGLVLGAWAGEQLVGFCMALPGHRPGQTFWHSHMTAVAASHRNQGLGRRMKLRQRELALEQGIELIEWTFDPLEIKNGYFNLVVLGAMTRRYHPDLYGFTSSTLQAGLPTDRLTAEWWLRSPRVEAAAVDSGGAAASLPAPLTSVEVAVPCEIGAWKAAQDARAAEAQLRIRAALRDAFAAGLAALDYRREADGSGAFLLGSPLEPEVKA